MCLLLASLNRSLHLNQTRFMPIAPVPLMEHILLMFLSMHVVNDPMCGQSSPAVLFFFECWLMGNVDLER